MHLSVFLVIKGMVDDLEKKRKQLKFRSWHRGTKEMDLLLGSFADQHLSGFSDEELVLYEQVLELNDLELYNWITGKESPPANMRNPVFGKLLAHKLDNRA